jgi:hypothetical protein
LMSPGNLCLTKSTRALSSKIGTIPLNCTLRETPEPPPERCPSASYGDPLSKCMCLVR